MNKIYKIMNEKKRFKCVLCSHYPLFSYERWEKKIDPVRYCCPDHWAMLQTIECWGTSKVWKSYMAKRKNHINNLYGEAVWCTICPTGDVGIEKMHELMHKLFKGALVRPKSWWCYEWRHVLPDFDVWGKLDNDGLHCHAWIRTTNINSFKTKVKRLCKRMNWVWPAQKIVKAKWPEQEKIDYVKGITFDTEKDIKKDLDKQRRKKYNIKHFFECGWGIDTIYSRLTYHDSVVDWVKGNEPDSVINNTSEKNEL